MGEGYGGRAMSDESKEQRIQTDLSFNRFGQLLIMVADNLLRKKELT